MADHEIPGVGIIRAGFGETSAMAEAGGGRRWDLASAGVFRMVFTATETATGTPVGELRIGRLAGHAPLQWYGHRYELTGGASRSTQTLAHDGLKLATYRSSGLGKRSFSSHVEDPRTDHGVVLFAAFIARILGRMTNA